MVQFTAALLFAAGAVGMVAAQNVYADFELDVNEATVFAGTVDILSAEVPGDITAGKAQCDSEPNCIGVICQADLANCITYSVGSSSSSANAGFDSISWKYDALFGPSCNSATDVYPQSDGRCICDYAIEEQNTAFGCIARAVAPSQAANANRVRRNRIQPGHAKKAFFEQQRVASIEQRAITPLTKDD